LITLSPLSADIFGGKASGSLAADMRPATPQSTVKIKLAGVDANSLLSAVSSVKNTVYGSLAADTNLRFALAPGNDLTRSLNGVLSFNLTNGVIKNVNLMGEINKIGKLLGTGGGDSSGGTELKKFLGTMNITNGVATTQNLTGALNAGTITGKGSLNLVSQDIDMHMTAALNGASSQPSGGVLSTVLATGKGGLVVPVLVTGNMAHPNVTPDTAEMAKLKLSNLGGKGLGGALGGLLGQNPADAKTKKSSNPLGGLLDQIKK
jgi:AsmA protein